jgi:hypothetical protein
LGAWLLILIAPQASAGEAPPDATFQRASRGRRTRAKARHGSFSTKAPVLSLLVPRPSSLVLPPASLRHLKLPRTYPVDAELPPQQSRRKKRAVGKSGCHGATPPITASSRAPPPSPLSCQAREREPGRQHHINGLIARLSHVQYCWRRRLSSALLLDTHPRIHTCVHCLALDVCRKVSSNLDEISTEPDSGAAALGRPVLQASSTPAPALRPYARLLQRLLQRCCNAEFATRVLNYQLCLTLRHTARGPAVRCCQAKRREALGVRACVYKTASHSHVSSLAAASQPPLCTVTCRCISVCVYASTSLTLSLPSPRAATSVATRIEH